MAWTTPGTATAGEVLTAAFWNEQVRDNLTELAPFFTDWTSYTPQIDQGATTNIAKTVNYAKYLKIGRMVIVAVRLSITGTGTGGSAILVSTPSGADISANVSALGSGRVIDSSVADYQVVVTRQANQRLQFVNATGNTGGQYVGENPNFALASSDSITFTIMYESTS